MKTILDRANSRGYADHGWLKSHHTFSFADYYNTQRIHFGALRVLNDDVVAPGMGFDLHPHKNMEVVSIPLKGFLKHGDSLSHSDVITPGDIQVMSAGSGISHSEYNDSPTDSLELLQIWVIPKVANTTPVYKNYDIRKVDKKNKFGFIIAPHGITEPAILQDAWFALGDLEKGVEVNYKLHSPDSGVYYFVIEGEVRIGDTTLSRRDGMGIWDLENMNVKALADSCVLLMEVPML